MASLKDFMNAVNCCASILAEFPQETAKEKRQRRERQKKRVSWQEREYYPGKMTGQPLLPDVKVQNKTVLFIRDF